MNEWYTSPREFADWSFVMVTELDELLNHKEEMKDQLFAEWMGWTEK